MDKLRDALTRKLGPLPVGVWAIAVLGGVGVAVAVRRRALTAEREDAAAEYAEVGAGMPGAQGPGPYNPGVGSGFGAGPYTPDGQPVQDDDEGDQAPAWFLDFSGEIGDQFANLTDGLVELGGDVTDLAGEVTGVDSRVEDLANRPPGTPPRQTVLGHGNFTRADDAKKNAGWRGQTVKGLVKQGYNEQQIKSAFDRFFDGKSLTGAQRTIVNEGIARSGAPPKAPTRQGGNKPDRNKQPKGPDRRDNGKPKKGGKR